MSTGRELAREYGLNLTERDTVSNPGAFEGEGLTTIYFYAAMMNGDGDIAEDEFLNVYTTFTVDSGDISPDNGLDIADVGRVFSIWTTDTGFVLGGFRDSEY